APWARAHRHYPRCFRASAYKPREPGPCARAEMRASLLAGPTRGMARCPAPDGVGSWHIAYDDVLRGVQRPERDDEVTSRVLALTRIGGASRCPVETPREGRLAIARGRGRTRWRTRDCAAAPRSAPTCFASPHEAAGFAGAQGSPGNRAMTARAPRADPA